MRERFNTVKKVVDHCDNIRPASHYWRIPKAKGGMFCQKACKGFGIFIINSLKQVLSLQVAPFAYREWC
tara:strand:- start:11799 stop:12005 length:207 start_codon:yes stop_codon:yes gene_type:complete